jgi:ABC-type spermidine/putrescine transport system permease subunit II
VELVDRRFALRGWRALRIAYLAAVLAAVAIFVLAPPLYVVVYVVAHAGTVLDEAFRHYLTGSAYWQMMVKALGLSLRLALATLAVDLVVGLPLSYLIARRKLRGYTAIENLVVLSLVLPTSAFGFAALMAWSSPAGLSTLFGYQAALIPQDAVVPVIEVPALLLMVHVALTLPYLVRPLTATIETLGEAYELVSRSLGASILTTFRRIVLPLVAPSLITGSVLALTRSLGETGATLIVAGVNFPASVAIVRLVGALKLGLASLLASMLVASTLSLVMPVELLSKRFSVRVEVKDTRLERVLLKVERKLSSSAFLAKLFKAALVTFLIFLLITPIATVVKMLAEYWLRDPYTGKAEGGAVYQVFGPAGYWPRIVRAAANSFLVASLATLVAVYTSILLFAAVRRTKLLPVVRALLRVPLIVPTSATGLSALLLYGESGLNLVQPSIWLTLLVHISFATPVVFETLISTYESLEVDPLEEVARTLGATPYDALETVTLPVMKRGITAGAVLAFLGSLGETGATMMVMGKDEMLTVLIVNMAEAMAIPAALFTSALLLLYALAALFLLRRFVR